MKILLLLLLGAALAFPYELEELGGEATMGYPAVKGEALLADPEVEVHSNVEGSVRNTGNPFAPSPPPPPPPPPSSNSELARKIDGQPEKVDYEQRKVAGIGKAADRDAKILSQYQESNPDGSFKYGFETDNGISVNAGGALGDVSNEPESGNLVVEGSYNYVSPNGKLVKVTYVADKNGFRPKSETSSS